MNSGAVAGSTMALQSINFHLIVCIFTGCNMSLSRGLA